MKRTHMMAIVAVVTVFAGLLWGQQAAPKAAKVAAYEYKVMSLAEMFKDSKNAQKKIAELVVHVQTPNNFQFQRTDMDVRDYDEALNRLAQEGWELVTVNKSNYWVFRRPK